MMKDVLVAEKVTTLGVMKLVEKYYISYGISTLFPDEFEFKDTPEVKEDYKYLFYVNPETEMYTPIDGFHLYREMEWQGNEDKEE